MHFLSLLMKTRLRVQNIRSVFLLLLSGESQQQTP
jgi:hypothetical protein